MQMIQDYLLPETGDINIEISDTVQELKQKIIQEINSITPEKLSKVMNSTVGRAHYSLTDNGGHLTDMVFQNLNRLDLIIICCFIAIIILKSTLLMACPVYTVLLPITEFTL